MTCSRRIIALLAACIASAPFAARSAPVSAAADSPEHALALARAGQVVSPEPVDGPLAPLVLLADTRAAQSWPAIVAAIGTDLPGFEAALRKHAETLRAALRDDRISRTGFVAARANRTQWIGVNPAFKARREIARTLAFVDLDAALAELATLEADASLGDGHDGSRALAFLAHANMLADRGRDAEALDVLARARAIYPQGNDSSINIDVNAAAIEVERGQPVAALALLDRAGDPYAHRMANQQLRVIESGAVQYRWMRACAHEQLGRTDEAASLMRAFVGDPFATPPMRIRAALCSGDVDMLAAALVDGMRSGPGSDALILQPATIAAANPRRRALLAAARARPEVAELYAATQRDLPSEYATILAQGEQKGPLSRALAVRHSVVYPGAYDHPRNQFRWPDRPNA